MVRHVGFDTIGFSRSGRHLLSMGWKVGSLFSSFSLFSLFSKFFFLSYRTQLHSKFTIIAARVPKTSKTIQDPWLMPTKDMFSIGGPFIFWLLLCCSDVIVHAKPITLKSSQPITLSTNQDDDDVVVPVVVAVVLVAIFQDSGVLFLGCSLLECTPTAASSGSSVNSCRNIVNNNNGHEALG